MASENELQIVLTLIDNASAELKKITSDVKKDTQEISKESEKAGKSLGDSMKDARKQIIDLRRQMFAATLVITAMYLAVKEYAKYNKEANQSIQELEKNLSLVKVVMGGFILQLYETIKPSETFHKNMAIISYWVKQIIGDMGGAKLRPMDFLGGDIKETIVNAEKIIEATDEMKNFKKELSDANLLFLTGRSSAQEYYNVISSNTAMDMSNRQMLINLMQAQATQENSNFIATYQNAQTMYSLRQQLATQEDLMRNQSLMDETTDTQAKMGLLKTLQSYHHTVYSSMMDFATMTIQKVSTGMTTTISSIIMGTKKAGEAWKEFGKMMITAIVEFVVQYAIESLLLIAMGWLMTAMVVKQAAVIGSAWAEPAALASLATLGLNAVPATAALIGTSSLAAGLAATTSKLTLGQIAGAAADTAGEAAVGYQSGGWAGLRGPELAVLGERGPEYVVPNNRLGNMGNQTSIYIEINNPVVRSDEDIDKLTEEISLRLAREAERL